MREREKKRNFFLCTVASLSLLPGEKGVGSGGVCGEVGGGIWSP